jgi:hypothetical protein
MEVRTAAPAMSARPGDGYRRMCSTGRAQRGPTVGRPLHEPPRAHLPADTKEGNVQDGASAQCRDGTYNFSRSPSGPLFQARRGGIMALSRWPAISVERSLLGAPLR